MAAATPVRGVAEAEGTGVGPEGAPAVELLTRVAQTSVPARPSEAASVRVVGAALGPLVAATPPDTPEAVGGAWQMPTQPPMAIDPHEEAGAVPAHRPLQG